MKYWYFMGVKDSLLFLVSPDDETPFRVIDLKSRKQLFRDELWGAWKDAFNFRYDKDGTMTMQYRRRVVASCSLAKDGQECWYKIRQRNKLGKMSPPKCLGYMAAGAKNWVPGDDGVSLNDINDPSVINYPVSVSLFPHPLVKALAGFVGCTAAP